MNRSARIDSRESPRFALRIAGPSKYYRQILALVEIVNHRYRLGWPGKFSKVTDTDSSESSLLKGQRSPSDLHNELSR